MNESPQTTQTCPLCKKPAEIGCLMGKRSGIINNGLMWNQGEPTVWKNILPLGEPLGEEELFKGSYLLGLRCNNCKKIILDF